MTIAARPYAWGLGPDRDHRRGGISRQSGAGLDALGRFGGVEVRDSAHGANRHHQSAPATGRGLDTLGCQKSWYRTDYSMFFDSQVSLVCANGAWRTPPRLRDSVRLSQIAAGLSGRRALSNPQRKRLL